MYHKLACSIADICRERNWVTEDRHSWCVYAIERKINTWTLCVILLIIALAMQRLAQTLLFFGSVTALRRRLGGWHAQSAWGCQLVSIVSVLMCVFVFGPCIERASTHLILILIAVMFFAYFVVEPVYPKQLHFTEADGIANNKKKKQILFVMFVGQTIGIALGTKVIAVYCLLGMLMAYISLIAEKCMQEKRKLNR